MNRIDIKFDCTKCDKPLIMNWLNIGKHGSCPICKSKIFVPGGTHKHKYIMGAK